MEKYKKYIIYAVITLVFSFFGAALVCSTAKKNFGSTADWFSAVGSLAAILFAYLQNLEQRYEYEEDKRQLKLSKRPRFEIYTSNILNNSDETFFLAAEQIKRKQSKDYFLFDRKNNLFLLINDKNYKFFWGIKNVANYAAINPTLTITYKYAGLEREDTIRADTMVQSGKEVKFLTNVVIDDKKINLNRANIEIELYFMSTDGNYYKQTFKQHKGMIILKDGTAPDQTTYESEKIEEIEKDKFPIHSTAIEMKVVDKPGDSPEVVPIKKLNNWYI